ncbi:MAG: hypothetical protein SFX73_29180 [Kofleriaceae bacterium]|nr:hypothetical protein [Kofleriaceae bacterium]
MLKTTDELKDRIEARKHDLLSKLHELKADTRREAIEASDVARAKLEELEQYLKDGWTNVSEATRAKLNRWLDRG